MLWLNGISLESLDPKVKLLNVVEQSPKMSIKTTDKAKYDGLRRLSRHRTTLSIRADFTIRDRHYYRRREIFDDVLAWLGEGGLLESEHREGQSIQVEVTDYPNLSSIRDFANTCSVTFTAYDPGWKATTPTTMSLTTTNAQPTATGTIQPPGTEETTFLEFTITNKGVIPMDTVSVSVNNRTISFAALNLLPNITLSLSYDENGYQRITSSLIIQNIFSKRTAESADDLILFQRKSNRVTVKTSAPASVTLKAIGRYR